MRDFLRELAQDAVRAVVLGLVFSTIIWAGTVGLGIVRYATAMANFNPTQVGVGEGHDSIPGHATGKKIHFSDEDPAE